MGYSKHRTVCPLYCPTYHVGACSSSPRAQFFTVVGSTGVKLDENLSGPMGVPFTDGLGPDRLTHCVVTDELQSVKCIPYNCTCMVGVHNKMASLCTYTV